METKSPHFVVMRAAAPGPVVVEIPHAGLEIDAASSRFTRIPDAALAAGALVADSDVGSDLPWQGSEQRGVTRIVARSSRYVIDLNTEPHVPTPYEDKMPDALRSVMRRSACGHRWREPPLPRHEVERRIREVFEPYHQRVELELERARSEHGAAVLLASHTFPDAGASVADVVIGTRHATTASEGLREALADVVRSHGFTVALEIPFAGGFSCDRHARRGEVSVVQLEIARRRLCADRRNLDTDPEAVARIAHMVDDIVVVATSHAMRSRG